MNNRPFIFYLQSIFVYLFSNRIYVWNQRKLKQKIEEKTEENHLIVNKNKNIINSLSQGLETNINEE